MIKRVYTVDNDRVDVYIDGLTVLFVLNQKKDASDYIEFDSLEEMDKQLKSIIQASFLTLAEESTVEGKEYNDIVAIMAANSGN